MNAFDRLIKKLDRNKVSRSIVVPTMKEDYNMNDSNKEHALEPGTVYSNSKSDSLVSAYSACMSDKHRYALLDYSPNEPMPLKVHLSNLSKEKLLELLKQGGYEFNRSF